MIYSHQEIEKKWQAFWKKNDIYKAQVKSKDKYYILDMFPYPSGAGLHVGHPKGYIATDIIARKKLMSHYEVIHPMGWDAFGLPAENYALKNKVHPRPITEENIANYKRQLNLLGLSYNWDREISTIDADYYRWTQWIFLQMWKQGLAYESYEPINWCPSCKTGLANEDLESGNCERCGSEVIQKPMRQWMLRITNYADRLLDDLEQLPDWEEPIKEMQRNWIGRSYGAEIDFNLEALDKKITVFTTRLDTIFAVSYLAIAPEHSILQEISSKVENWKEVERYIEEAKHKTELFRTELNKEKTGLELKGVLVKNPASGETIPVFVADYVLNSYGTGAVMAVPAHDIRDNEFAKKYKMRFKEVIRPENRDLKDGELFTEDGILFNSLNFNNLKSAVAREEILSFLETKNLARAKVNYKLEDWVFSRQRYWGEPIPLIHCKDCGVVPVPEEELPVLLPEIENYEPSGTGESPLAKIDSWINTSCPKCSGPAKRESNTMPQWGGSSWYYLRYLDPKNDKALLAKEIEKKYMPVDLYVGGAEHATRHLIYARFWHKFLYDIGILSSIEPFKKLRHVGLIMGEDNRKMSKRWGNVVNPDDIVISHGADAMRVYEMFMGPFDQSSSWSGNGLNGARKFLEKSYRIIKASLELPEKEDSSILKLLHRTIKKVSQDIEDFHFNTAVSSLMIFVNSALEKIEKNGSLPIKKEDLLKFVKLLAPFAPHLGEEAWSLLGNSESVFNSSWPIYDKEYLVDERVNYIIQINGKLRGKIEADFNIEQESLLELVRADEKLAKWLESGEIKKIIFLPGKLLNIVV